MVRTIAFPLISLMLIFSILAPSILPILDKEREAVVFTDTGEEENNQEKESEYKFDEKDLFLNSLEASDSGIAHSSEFGKIPYFSSKSDSNSEIHLPPPRTQA